MSKPSKCIDCKWAFLDAQERLTIKLQNKPQIFECLYGSNPELKARCHNYHDILLRTYHCRGFEPCP